MTILIGQHVDAVRAITREGVTNAANPIGGRLARELEEVARAHRLGIPRREAALTLFRRPLQAAR